MQSKIKKHSSICCAKPLKISVFFSKSKLCAPELGPINNGDKVTQCRNTPQNAYMRSNPSRVYRKYHQGLEYFGSGIRKLIDKGFDSTPFSNID